MQTCFGDLRLPSVWFDPHLSFRGIWRVHDDLPARAKLQIEHVVPRKHGGGDETTNLALACVACNLRKGPNLTGIDPDTGQVVELFNPRMQQWTEHFAWDGCTLVGITATGRTTIRVLDMNSSDRIRVRVASAR